MGENITMKTDNMKHIRPTKKDDIGQIKSLAVETELFTEEDAVFIGETLNQYFNGELGDDHFWVTYDDNAVIGVAYYAPEPMTDSVWNLYMLAVDPDSHGQGIGSALVTYVEQALPSHNGRMLLIETSGLDSFERTRSFYDKCGYELEARIRDYYAEGDDKVIFRKSLNQSSVD